MNRAIWHGHLECVHAALARLGTDRMCGLATAAEAGRIELLRLIWSWFDSNAGDREDELNLALKAAAWTGEVECLRQLLEWGASSLDDALSDAAVSTKENRIECARLLIKARATGVTEQCNVLQRQLMIWCCEYHGCPYLPMLKTLAETATTGKLWTYVTWLETLDGKRRKGALVLKRAVCQIVDGRVHAFLLGTALAFWPLDLPPYVILWITDWIEPHGLGARRRISLLEGVRNTARRLKEEQ